METLTSTNPTKAYARGGNSLKMLHLSAKLWFIIATAGQWLFAFYIAAFYGKSTVLGDFERWNKVLPHGYVKGEPMGNLMVGFHVLFALILVVGGPLQLMPQVRERFPVFHRWLGRAYIFTAPLVAIDGAAMVWTRGSVGNTFMHVCNTIQVFYIVTFAWLSIRYARERKFALHRAWTLRLFMVTNGVWFFRIELMAWLVTMGGPVGIDTETFTGPFLNALALFAYAVPLSLIVLELYWKAQKTNNPTFRTITTVVIFLCVILTAIGVFGATMGMWLPRI